MVQPSEKRRAAVNFVHDNGLKYEHCDTAAWVGLEFENARCVRDALIEKIRVVPDDFLCKLTAVPDSVLPLCCGSDEHEIPESFQMPQLMPLGGALKRAHLQAPGGTHWPSSPLDAHVASLPGQLSFEEADQAWDSLGKGGQEEAAAKFQASSTDINTALADAYESLQDPALIPDLLWVCGLLAREPNYMWQGRFPFSEPLPPRIKDKLFRFETKKFQDCSCGKKRMYCKDPPELPEGHTHSYEPIAVPLVHGHCCRGDQGAGGVGGDISVDPDILSIFSVDLTELAASSHSPVSPTTRCHAAAALIPMLDKLSDLEATWLVYTYFYSSGAGSIGPAGFCEADKDQLQQMPVGRVGRPFCILDGDGSSTAADEAEIRCCKDD